MDFSMYEPIDYIIVALSLYLIFGIGILKFGLSSRRGQRLVRIAGETGARLIYILAGVIAIITVYYGYF